MFVWLSASPGVQESKPKGPRLARLHRSHSTHLSLGYPSASNSFGGENWDYISDKILNIFSWQIYNFPRRSCQQSTLSYLEEALRKHWVLCGQSSQVLKSEQRSAFKKLRVLDPSSFMIILPQMKSYWSVKLNTHTQTYTHTLWADFLCWSQSEIHQCTLSRSDS